MNPIDRIKEAQASQEARVKELIAEAFAVQGDGKRSLSRFRKLLDAFVPTTLGEQRMVSDFSTTLQWRDAVSNGVPFNEAFLKAYGAKP